MPISDSCTASKFYVRPSVSAVCAALMAISGSCSRANRTPAIASHRRSVRDFGGRADGVLRPGIRGYAPCRLLRLPAGLTELPAIGARRQTGGPTECGGKRACLDESKRTTDLGYGLLSVQQ